MKKILSLLVVLGSVSACTWIEPSATGRQVSLVKMEHVEHCKFMGTTTSTGAQAIGPFKRDEEKVEKELATLAKNNAVVLGGDTIVATTPVQDDAQTFAVYRCKGN